MGNPSPPEDRPDACPWLIRRFIDAEAEIIFGSPDQLLTSAALLGARSFDGPGADYTHQVRPDGRGWRTFETLIDAFQLSHDPALRRLAAIVHAADIAADLHSDPLAPGLLAIGSGGLDVEPDDQQLLRHGSFVHDALYPWCHQPVSDAVPTAGMET